MADPYDYYEPHPYDPTVDGPDERVERIARVLDWQQATAIVAIVESFDATKGTVTATPCINARQGGFPAAYPPHPRVPVLWPCGGGRSFTWSLVPGDYVLLVYNMRSLDEWRQRGGGNIAPQSTRRFSLSDAIAIPGLRPGNAPLTQSVDNAMRMGDDPYGVKDFSGVLANVRCSATEIEIVLSGRTDEEGGDLADRIVRIDKATGDVIIGEEGRGVTVDDDKISVVDGNASVEVENGSVKATVGSAEVELTATTLTGTVGNASVVVESGEATVKVADMEFEVTADDIIVHHNGASFNLFEQLQVLATGMTSSPSATTVAAGTAVQANLVSLGFPVPEPE